MCLVTAHAWSLSHWWFMGEKRKPNFNRQSCWIHLECKHGSCYFDTQKEINSLLLSDCVFHLHSSLSPHLISPVHDLLVWRVINKQSNGHFGFPVRADTEVRGGALRRVPTMRQSGGLLSQGLEWPGRSQRWCATHRMCLRSAYTFPQASGPLVDMCPSYGIRHL